MISRSVPFPIFLRSMIAASLALAGHTAIAQAPTFGYLGQTITPNGATLASPTTFSSALGTTTVGGISGLEWSGSGNTYFGVIDGRNNTSLGSARFYNMTLDLAQFQRSNTPGSAGVTYSNAVTLRNGSTLSDPGYTQSQRDPESIRYLSASNTLLVSTEGFRQTGNVSNPTIEEVRPDGTRIRTFNVPALYNPTGSVVGTTAGDSGVRDNGGFEPMALTPDGSKAFVANEVTLIQDGASSAGIHRLTSFDVALGNALNQYVYRSEPGRGLVELLAIDNNRFIALERGGSANNGGGYAVELWLAEITGATTDITGVNALGSAPYTALQKTLLLNLNSLTNADNSVLRRGNVESLTWGPSFNGQNTLILASDNNFATSNHLSNGGTGAGDFTQYIALTTSLAPIPEPSMLISLLLGLGAIGGFARRRISAA
jgi:hypothetical protein